MPRVFIPQLTGRYSRNGESGAPEFQPHDHSDLRQFGEPFVIFKRDLYPDNAAELIDDAMVHAMYVLLDWRPEDYFCLMGSPLYISLCSVVMGLFNNFPCKTLRFDKMHSAYYEITFAKPKILEMMRIIPTIEEKTNDGRNDED